MWSRLVVLGLTVAAPQGTAAQPVPEGIHSSARGPVEMCGLKGKDVQDLVRQARRSRELRPVPMDSERFELFATAEPKYQLVITTPSEAAYPAATCRHLYEKDGALMMNRQLRCDAGKTECDALFREFEALDARMTEEIKGGNRD